MDGASARSVNRLIHVDFRKWMTNLHWQFTMRWLAGRKQTQGIQTKFLSRFLGTA